MAPRTVYANLVDGLQPIPQLLDQSFSDMGSLGVIPCTAAGTNAIVLTPIATLYPPNINNPPNNNQCFSFVAPATSTGSVTVQIANTTSFLKLYRTDASTQAGSGDIQINVTYVISFGSALNGAAGGFQIQSPMPGLTGNVVQSVTSDTNVTGVIAADNLTLGWAGTLAAARLNSNVVQAITNDSNVTGSISAQNLTLGWSGRLPASRFLTGTSGYALIGNGASDSTYQGFLNPGTGATTRTWQAKTQEVVSVTDFTGVVADWNGTTGTDNTAGFQRALDYLNSVGGGKLIVPFSGTGSYLFTLQASNLPPVLTVHSNTHIEINAGVRLLSQAIFGGFNSGLFTGTSGTKNVTISGPGGIKVCPPKVITGNTHSNTTIDGIASTSGLVVNMPIQGSGIPAGAYITTINSGTQITISSAATATASGVSLSCCYTGTPFIAMMGVDKFSIGGNLQFLDTYGATVGTASRCILSVTNFDIGDIYTGYEDRAFSGTSFNFDGDLFHCLGGTAKGNFHNIRGRSADDCIALNIENDGQVGWDTSITDINISNINVESGWAQLFRIFVDTTSTVGVVQRIKITNLNGAAGSLGQNSGSAGIRIEDLSSGGKINDVTISNVSIDCSSNGDAGAIITFANNVTIENWLFNAPNKQLINATSCTNLTIKGAKQSIANRTASTDGLLLTSCTDATIDGGWIENQKNSAINLSNCTRPIVAELFLESNGGNGIALSGTTSGALVHNNKFVSNTLAAIQEYNTANTNRLRGNDVASNGGGTITLLGSASTAIDNPGFNPVANSGVSPGGSPFTAGPFAYPVYVTMTGGTITSTVIDGRGSFGTVTNLGFLLPALKTAVITYSVAPTIAYYPQ